MNILFEENTRLLKNKYAVQEKIRRYDSLKTIIEQINQGLNLDTIAETLVDVVYSLVARQKGTCILYLVDQEAYRLSLYKTKKEQKDEVIKSKEGDPFDLWVLQHTSPLFIEDVKKDFRFDLEKLNLPHARPVSSLVSSPLVSGRTFLGIMRLDSPDVHAYSQDDMRLLVTICDLGALALENGQLFQKTQDLAIHDGLTGLFTKGYFTQRLHEECRRSSRKDTALSLLMLDIDHFKRYNDTFGHTAGDLVLKTLSGIMNDFFRGTNAFIGRFGGEEFCIVLPQTDKDKAVEVAEELRGKIAQSPIVLRRNQTHVTVSIGVASAPHDGWDSDNLLIKADRAMYAAKGKGRNRVSAA
jgi:diguanylate cyclase (GGDEF)-like protein